MSPTILGVGSAAAPSTPDAYYAASLNPKYVETTSTSPNTWHGQMSRVRYIADVGGIQAAAVMYSHWYYAEQSFGDIVTIRAAIEYPVGVFTPLVDPVLGGRDIVIAPNKVGVLHSDLNLAEGITFWVRTLATVNVGSQFAQAASTNDAFGEWTVDDTTTDETTSGSHTPVYAHNCIAPLQVFSRGGTARKIVAGMGDSIMTHQYLGRGLAESALNAAGIAWIDLAQIAEQANGITSTSKRLQLAKLCSTAISNYGVNDMINSVSAAALQSRLVTTWKALSGIGLRVIQTTITPVSTSTDSWATVANQTPHANNAARTATNDWIRGGAPIDSSDVPVAVGTPGAKVAGGAGHPLYGYYEVADTVESARNSGKWKATTGAFTSDGTHPTTLSLDAAQAAFDTSVII